VTLTIWHKKNNLKVSHKRENTFSRRNIPSNKMSSFYIINSPQVNNILFTAYGRIRRLEVVAQHSEPASSNFYFSN